MLISVAATLIDPQACNGAHPPVIVAQSGSSVLNTTVDCTCAVTVTETHPPAGMLLNVWFGYALKVLLTKVSPAGNVLFTLILLTAELVLLHTVMVNVTFCPTCGLVLDGTTEAVSWLFAPGMLTEAVLFDAFRSHSLKPVSDTVFIQPIGIIAVPLN